MVAVRLPVRGCWLQAVVLTLAWALQATLMRRPLTLAVRAAATEHSLVIVLLGLPAWLAACLPVGLPLQIPAFKAVGTAKLKMDVLCRKGIVCKDISKGKEATPVVAVNEVREGSTLGFRDARL